MSLPRVYIDNQEIDLPAGAAAVLLSYAVVDPDDLTKRKSSHSRVIKAPGTRKNRKIFSFQENPAISPQLTEARVVLNGLVFMNGRVKMVQTIIRNGHTEYHFMIIGQNSWQQVLSSSKMSDLDLSLWNHPYSAESIIWAHNNINQTPFLYLNYKAIQVGDFFMPGMDVTLFKLGLNVNRLVKKVFKEAGYKLKSSFIDSGYFERLWYCPKFNPRSEDVLQLGAMATNENQYIFNSPASGSGITEKDIDIAFDYDQPTLNLVNTGCYDHSNLYDTDSNTYTVNANQGYTISLEIPISGASPTDRSTYIELLINGLTFEEVILTAQQVYDSNSISATFDKIHLRSGDQVTFRIYQTYTGGTYTPYSYTVEANKAFFTVEPLQELVTYDLVRIAEMYMSDTNQINFLKDLTTLFNLHFITDERLKIVYCEPFGNFYTSEVKVISEKIDRAKEANIERASAQYAQKIKFKYPNQEVGGIINNPAEFGDESQENSLSFFNSSNLRIDTGFNVPDFEPDNQLLYFDGLLTTGNKYLPYRHRNFDIDRTSTDPVTRSNADNQYRTDQFPLIRFSDASVNLNFHDAVIKGLLNTYYRDFIRELGNLKKITTYTLWDFTEIFALENLSSSEMSFQAIFFDQEFGRMRLQEIKDFDPSSTRSVESSFLTDIAKTPISLLPSFLQPAIEIMGVRGLISFIKVGRYPASGTFTTFEIVYQQIDNGIPDWVTVEMPYINSIDRSYFTLKTLPGGFSKLTLSGGSVSIGNEIANSEHILKTLPTAIEDNSITPIHFFSDASAPNDHWIAGYGYESKITAGISSPMKAVIRTIQGGSIFRNAYLEITINGGTTNSALFVLNSGIDRTQNFNITLPDEGFYNYTIKLYVELNPGGFDLQDRISSKLYCHGQ